MAQFGSEKLGIADDADEIADDHLVSRLRLKLREQFHTIPSFYAKFVSVSQIDRRNHAISLHRPAAKPV